MSLFYTMPVATNAFFADAHADFQDIEKSTLSFRQLRVALPQFLFDELFDNSQASDYMQAAPEFVPTAQQFKPHGAVHSPLSKRAMTRASRKRADSISSNSSSDSMKLAAEAAAGSPDARRKKDASGSNRYLIKCIRALPVDLQSCFTEWRRERKEAILTHDVEKQKCVERVMWNALNNINGTQMQ